MENIPKKQTLFLLSLLLCLSVWARAVHSANEDCYTDGPKNCIFSAQNFSKTTSSICSWTVGSSINPIGHSDGIDFCYLRPTIKLGNITSRIACSAQGREHCLEFRYSTGASGNALSVVLRRRGGEETLWSAFSSTGWESTAIPINTGAESFQVVFVLQRLTDSPIAMLTTPRVNYVSYQQEPCSHTSLSETTGKTLTSTKPPLTETSSLAHNQPSSSRISTTEEKLTSIVASLTKTSSPRMSQMTNSIAEPKITRKDCPEHSETQCSKKLEEITLKFESCEAAAKTDAHCPSVSFTLCEHVGITIAVIIFIIFLLIVVIVLAVFLAYYRQKFLQSQQIPDNFSQASCSSFPCTDSPACLMKAASRRRSSEVSMTFQTANMIEMSTPHNTVIVLNGPVTVASAAAESGQMNGDATNQQQNSDGSRKTGARTHHQQQNSYGSLNTDELTDKTSVDKLVPEDHC